MGIIEDTTREELLNITRGMRVDGSVRDILGCTVLSLIIDKGVYEGIPFLHMTAIRVDAIVEYYFRTRCRC